MTGKAREILVNTDKEDHNNDPSITSLREAITEANKSENNGEKIYINFRKINDNKSWHITPDSPLPAITHSQIFFNQDHPKNVTIDGSLVSKKSGTTYSLITVGNYTKINSNELSRPKAAFKNINFVNNTARAGDGTKGGGGGLAAGAGMSILQGDVTLENVVFQNLQAIGGRGAIGAHGASGASNKNKRGAEDGNSGGAGGLPTLLGATASRGGHGGHSGIHTEKNEGHPVWISESRGTNGHDGSNGSFGVGGGGGGGGGGGAYIQGETCSISVGLIKWFSCKKTPDIFGDGGHGGKGGKGGFGAGGGGGGTAGENAFGKGSPQPGGAGGAGGSVHGGSNHHGRRGGDSWNSNGFQRRGGDFAGGSGDALGAALAILNSSSNVELINVDFIGNKAISRNHKVNNIYAINAENRGGKITGESNYFFTKESDKEGQELPHDIFINNEKNYIKARKKPDGYKPSNIHEATSFNRNDALAKIRNSEIKHRPGHADITTIRVEEPASTIRSINIDSSALENSINDIYKRIIPVEEEKMIKNRFKERILSAVKSAALSGYSSHSKAETFFKASEGKYTSADKSNAIRNGAVLAGAGMLFSIWEAHSAYQKELAQNKENLKELTKLQAVDRGATADPIDIGQSRSVITVKNFTIGEDTIYLEDFWSNNLQDFSPIIRNGMGKANDEKVETFEIHLKTGSNAPTKVAEVQLDNESVRKLNSALQTDAVGYINALLRPNLDQKRWEIGTTLTDPQRIFQSSNHYTGGPAGEIVVIERPILNNLSGIWSTTTFNYDDRITGSKGTEKITTNGGNDFIEPNYGRDTVNGGESIDWVNYADLNEPIRAIGNTAKNDLQQTINTITINNKYSHTEGNILDSTLENIEVVSSFGASSFDFSAAPSPNPLRQDGASDELPGFYAMRSGSGSTIQGSNFNDRIIISLMDDENPSKYTDTSKQANTNSKHNILRQPSIIVGNKGNDQLSFAFNNHAPDLIIKNLENDDEYKGFKAVIDKTTNTAIAFFQGIDPSQVKAIHEATDKPANPITINSESFQYTFQKPSTEEIVEATNTENNARTKLDAYDETNPSPDALQTPSQPTDKPLKAIYGQRGKDSLIGGPTADIIAGRKGDDQLKGKAGDDIFIGGAGRNHIEPGRGHDQIHLHRHGIQIIHGFNPRKDLLVMPRNFRDSLLDFSKSKITYDDQLIAKIVDF